MIFCFSSSCDQRKAIKETKEREDEKPVKRPTQRQQATVPQMESALFPLDNRVETPKTRVSCGEPPRLSVPATHPQPEGQMEHECAVETVKLIEPPSWFDFTVSRSSSAAAPAVSPENPTTVSRKRSFPSDPRQTTLTQAGFGIEPPKKKHVSEEMVVSPPRSVLLRKTPAPSPKKVPKTKVCLVCMIMKFVHVWCDKHVHRKVADGTRSKSSRSSLRKIVGGARSEKKKKSVKKGKAAAVGKNKKKKKKSRKRRICM